jgi:ubiquinone/menaquinone biosynthesis C-methylase UbiE
MTSLDHRIEEPELMDDDVQAKAYAEADFAAPHNAWVDAALSMIRQQAGIVLDVGCGPADVVTRLALRAPRMIIDGVDGAEAMLALGRKRVDAFGLGNRVRLHRCLLPHDALPRTAYDVVTSNSILHHLHQPQALWTTLRRASRPGTEVFIADLMRPASTDAAQAIVDQHAANEPDILRRDFYASLLAAFTVSEVKDQLAAAGMSHLQVSATSDRHLLVHGVMR